MSGAEDDEVIGTPLEMVAAAIGNEMQAQWLIAKEASPDASGPVMVDTTVLASLAIDALMKTGRFLPNDGRNHKLDTDRHVFFYEQEFYVLSNFSSFTLMWRGWRFDTAEAAYHFEKFMFEDDHTRASEIRTNIREAPSAHEAFKIAERNKLLRRSDWDDVKVDIMREILRAKIAQHEYVRRKLMETGQRELAEDSWRDSFWGWAPDGAGQNMLGKLWMELRARLQVILG